MILHYGLGIPSLETLTTSLAYTESLYPSDNKSWMILGDFNELSCSIEKSRHNLDNSSRFSTFNDFVNWSGLIDLGYQRLPW